MLGFGIVVFIELRQMISPSRLVNKSTCRINCDNGHSIGTGFLFSFMNSDKPDEYIPVLVTNKHVIKGASTALIRMNIIKDSVSSFYDLTIDNVESLFIMHPDPNVDLCVIPMSSWFREAEVNGFMPDVFIFSSFNMNGADKLMPIEEVYMTGYPNGLWDEVNNKPITRKGITASDFNQDWNGAPEFMIDMACFGGSSGSPVFIMNEGSFAIDTGIVMGTRLILLGILYAGPQVNVNGTIEVINVPTAAVAVSTSKVMMNLGLVVKAEKLKDFEPLLT